MLKVAVLGVVAVALLVGCSEPVKPDPFAEDRKKVFKDGPMSGTGKPLTIPSTK